MRQMAELKSALVATGVKFVKIHGHIKMLE